MTTQITETRYVIDGKVAVLISPGLGAGWYTWNRGNKDLGFNPLDMLFDPDIVQMVLDGRPVYDIELRASTK